MEFEYDPAKSARNLTKHGIDFEVAQELWNDSDTVTMTSKDSVNDDRRWLTIGKIGGKHWTAVTTRRGDRIRIISVRRSRDKEEAIYERKQSDHGR